MLADANAYDVWLAQVSAAFNAINMPMETWQPVSAFDFLAELEE